MGLQYIASYFTLAIQYLIGMTLSALLGLKMGWGVIGLQAGNAVALSL